ncbi:MAG: hypothetical protein NVSMB67_04420 [Flavisolibacter sp.]
MKNTILLVFSAIFLSLASRAQSTADSIQAKYKLQPMPQALSMDKIFPIVGTYQMNASPGNGPIVISLDSTNKGMVWIEGLPEGKIKAFLKMAPTTYRIIAQKSASGRDIPEGTMIFNQEANKLNISLGAPFNEADPSGIFTIAANHTEEATASEEPVKVKTKTKTAKTKFRVLFYTAVKTLTTGNATSSTNL